MKSLALFSVLALTSPTFAGDLDILSPFDSPPATIQPRTPDIIPHDGFFDAGSTLNPYIMEQGTSRYEIKPRFPDIVPGDGFFDSGTAINPWTIERVR